MTENGVPLPWAWEKVGGSQTTMSNFRPREAKRSSALVASIVTSSMRPAARPLSSALRRARACTLATLSTETTSRAPAWAARMENAPV